MRKGRRNLERADDAAPRDLRRLRERDVLPVEQNRILPRVGAKNLVSRLKQVVLPAPFGPISAWIVPRTTFRLTSLTATKPLNSFVSDCVSMMMSLALTGLPSRGALGDSPLLVV
jgi:hypothetical protein